MWGKRQPKPSREERLAASAARLMASVTPRASVVASAREASSQRQKETFFRSEEYRRLVASLPCANCGLHGYSQHAHENAGKAKGMKVCDLRAMPLCCARPGVEGCHSDFDQYKLFTTRQEHIDQGRAWVTQTQQTILDSGKWPKNIPKPDKR